MANDLSVHAVPICVRKGKKRRTPIKNAIVRVFLPIVAQRFAHTRFYWVCECAVCASPIGDGVSPHSRGGHTRPWGGAP